MTSRIKFPKVHIATSVINRILNVADGLGMTSSGQAEPSVPQGTQALGTKIEQAATARQPELEASGDPLAGSVARGENLVDSL